MSEKGKLFIISGPSGAGKGTIVSELKTQKEDYFKLSVSATTRAPREGETDGISYYFLSKEEFLEKVDKGEFLEYATVHENYYGTPAAPVMEQLQKGCNVILEIDVQGGMQVKENYEDAVLIFILPPSIEILRERLVGRGSESEEQVAIRMGKALEEIGYVSRYEYAVVNDDLQTAVDEVLSIMTAEHCRTEDKADEIIRRYREE